MSNCAMAFLSDRQFIYYSRQKVEICCYDQEERKPKSHVHSIMKSVIAMISFSIRCDVGGLGADYFCVNLCQICVNFMNCSE